MKNLRIVSKLTSTSSKNNQSHLAMGGRKKSMQAKAITTLRRKRKYSGQTHLKAMKASKCSMELQQMVPFVTVTMTIDTFL